MTGKRELRTELRARRRDRDAGELAAWGALLAAHCSSRPAHGSVPRRSRRPT